MAAPIGKVGKAGKAVILRNPGGTEKLTLVQDWYTHYPEPGYVMVHNVYTSVNPVDCYQRSGAFRVQYFPKARRRTRACASAWCGRTRVLSSVAFVQVLGSDVAGTVVQAPAHSQARGAARRGAAVLAAAPQPWSSRALGRRAASARALRRAAARTAPR